MATGNHDVDITFKGDVFDVHVELEGLPINLHFDMNSGAFLRTLTAFPVDGDLNLFIQARGLNGTKWSFEMSVDDKGPFKTKGRIVKGVSRVTENIQLPLTDAK
jgi:hypothetical protein